MKIICQKKYILDSLIQAFDDDMIVESMDEDGEIMVCDPELLNKKGLENLSQLKLAISPRDGVDKVDLDYLKEKNIMLVNGHSLYSKPIAEFVVMRVLEYSTNAYQYAHQQIQKKYQTIPNRKTLDQLRIGFIGTGSICQMAAKLLKAFGCFIVGYKRNRVEKLENFDELYYDDQLKEMVKDCDIIIVGVDLNASTYHLINEDLLKSFKDKSALINISRGSVIDEKIMPTFLDNGKLSYFASDVFQQEPLPTNSLLWNYPQVRISPHCSGIADKNHDCFAQFALEVIEQYKRKEKLKNRVI